MAWRFTFCICSLHRSSDSRKNNTEGVNMSKLLKVVVCVSLVIDAWAVLLATDICYIAFMLATLTPLAIFFKIVGYVNFAVMCYIFYKVIQYGKKDRLEEAR